MSPDFVASDCRPGPVILLGLGFTTRRLARLLLLRGISSYAIARQRSRFRDLVAAGLRVEEPEICAQKALPANSVLIHTIPPLPPDENENLRKLILGLKPRRIIYISSTSVYGNHIVVDARTAAEPSEEKGQRRVEEENWIARNAGSSLILRPAAIYGPGRGVHVRIKEGRSSRAAGTAMVSRVHVDDLAALLLAGVESELEGAWPVADDLPCSTDAITAWCRHLIGQSQTAAPAEPIRIAGRQVNGRDIRDFLRVSFAYPSYYEGILASLAEIPVP